MSGQIGTGVDVVALTGGNNGGGATGGKFGIDDNTSEVNRSVDMGGNSLSLNNVSEFNIKGAGVTEFVPYTYDDVEEIGNMEVYLEVPFPGYEDKSMIELYEGYDYAPYNELGLDTKFYFIIDGQPTQLIGEFVLFEEQFPVYFVPKITDEAFTAIGYDSVISNLEVSLDVPKIPANSEIQPENVLFVNDDNKLRIGKIPTPQAPSWMDTLNTDASITGNVYAFMNNGTIFNMYGTNPTSPVFYVSNNTNPILAKLQIGVGQNGFLDAGLSFFNDHTLVRRYLQYQLDNNDWMIQFDRTIPDCGFVRGSWGYVKRLYDGVSSAGSKDYFIEIFSDTGHSLVLSKDIMFKGKTFVIKVSGQANVTLSVSNDGTINGKNSMVLVPGTTIEVIRDELEYRIVSATCKITNSDVTDLLTVEQINALYPDALEGFEVYCPNTTPPVLYRKTGWVNTWIGIEPRYFLTPV